jgi:hypothetical protein
MKNPNQKIPQGTQEWTGTSVERDEDGHLEIVRERTKKQEQAHRRNMDRWARRNYERD